ncbi:ATP-dependent DNA helicase RecG [Aeromicrobium phragmitis]|uniref:ATP-dependent DNA helicase RecG n=1 Tax=Aeromicrobium phragmitis TaxID=2478914 RepID=A0A3L8PI92_9ACTN|nr:ATP-dependent DNA helicase RecG [Aeromicrobium phragmitis]RLV54820.1 ATP-dependent DNA helicase RecG [Aeromicrobium phragmitis]
MVRLDSKLGPVVGKDSATKLHKAFGMETVGDLLTHYPRRYIDLEQSESLADLEPGQYVTFAARVVEVKNFSLRSNPRKTRTQVRFTDGRTTLTATFFNQSWLVKSVKPDSLQLFAGVVGEYRGQPQLTHPVMKKLPDGGSLTDAGSGYARGIIPVYSATSSIASWELENAVATVLAVLDAPEDPLPVEVRDARGWPDLDTALRHIHQPTSRSQWWNAQQRLRFDEAFVLQSIFARRRRAFDDEPAVARPRVPGGLVDRFVDRLPFELTHGQQLVFHAISRDLEQSHPMHRLLQGEVGSGKTVVALLAMLRVVENGGQAALLAPTEVLAAQHYRSITTQLGDLAKGGMLGGAEGATRVRLLTGSMGAKARKEALLDIVSGEAGIVVGTHALLQETVEFADLGLVVVDEQHRFGVEQRAALVDRAAVAPHVLVMTATPIPRTVAMTVFGDLETSTLQELPAGRQQIQTTVVPVAEHPGWLERAWERVREEVDQGRQVYIVTTRIGGDDDDAKRDTEAQESNQPRPVALLDVVEMLREGPLHGLRLGMLHGRMPTDEKDAAMAAFAGGDLDVLVATTVIEVGVDVANATMMVVLDADRFGLSQLHQLRGRVGRGGHPGLCLLVTGVVGDTLARERLDAVASTTDGFRIAEFDIELRREGDVLGARQSGHRSSLKLLSVVAHDKVIAEAREVANQVVADDPNLDSLPALREAVLRLEATQQAEYLERT